MDLWHIRGVELPADQLALRRRCFHRSGEFGEFPIADVSTSIPACFEKIVRRQGGRLAVKTSSRRMTYEELNRAANRLAHLLLASRRGAEPVAVYLSDRVSMIVAILAVLKAGKFFVPLETSFPPSRNAYVLNDCGAELILTDRANLHGAEALGGSTGLLLMEESETVADAHGPDVTIGSDDLVYVLHTSGSSGQFKGIGESHRNVLYDICWFVNYVHVGTADRLTLLHPLSSAAAGLHLYGSLLTGATVFPYDLAGTGVDGMARWLRDEAITIWHSLPSVFRQMIETLRPDERLPEIRLVQLSSAPVIENDIHQYRTHFAPECLFLHRIGSTEALTISARLMDKRTAIESGPLPLGWSPDAKQVLILDDNGRPAAAGAAGEIAVRSRFLAHGYWGKPELSPEKFQKDPSGDDTWMFLTGDLGRVTPEGGLTLLGRKDLQLKVRGFRVEPEQIERVLQRHPSVKEAVVIGNADADASVQLVGYFTIVEPPAPKIDALRQFLAERLPDYMIPSRFVRLDTLPLTPNGKVDRRALPAPTRERPDLSVPYTEATSAMERMVAEIWQDALYVSPVGLHDNFFLPRTPVEELLANIWAEVLKLDKVGIRDNFFDLGGHSLLATQVVARIRSALNVELPLRRLFESPTVHQLAATITAEHTTAQTRQLPPIERADRAGDFPLSFAQQRLWFIDQLEPENSVYNVPDAWRLSGPLDFTALQQSINEIVRRHEVLRTSFVTIDGQPIQHIQPFMTLSPDLIHLTELRDTERESTVELQIREEIHKPFDLARGPLLRAKLLKLSEDDHVLLLTMHHIVSDGWSMGVLFRELSRLYRAFARGNPSPLDDLPIQYADYAVWQRGWLHGDVLESQLAYWRRQLENLTVLQLPTDRQRPTVQHYRGARARVTFDSALRNKLWALSRDENATLYMTLLAAFQILLSRYSGQEDIAVGSPIASRSISELEGLIGCFFNTLVLRGDLSNNPTFREFLRRMRDVALEAYAHQDVPFEKLVEELSPRRDLNLSPLFQVMFVLQNDTIENLELKGLSVRSMSVDSETAKFDLLLSLWEDKLGLRGTFEYNTDLFEAATVERMLSHFQVLLEGIVADPDRRISDLPILTEAEKHQLLVERNDTKTDYPKDETVHRLFEARAVQSADGIAVICNEQQLTYAELNRRANQLAHYLINDAAVRPGDLVGVCLERGFELIVALLGILKTGGAYVPLDPGYPNERLAFMLQDSGANVVLTDEDSLGSLPPLSGRAICLDRDWKDIAKQPSFNPTNQNTADDLAYVIYTSGSTGLPKGVEVRHRGITRLLFGVDYAQLGATETLLHLAPISFDAATFEVWGALLHGGACVLFPGRVPDAAELGDVLKKYRISALWLTAALFNTVIDQEPQALSDVKQLLIGGETLSVRHVRKALAQLPNTKIINGYGPTEATTFTCCYPISRMLGDDTASIPIGRPIANTKVYILDAHLKPVPIGVAGEIYIGGDGLARGYLNRPDLTKERFIANPFSNDAGARLYKTGDQARYLADGNLEFLGRLDNQVKIRGYRIELREIEAVLGQHPAVRETVVLAREDSPGDKRLVAYVVAGGNQVEINALRDFLKQKLPNYMVPSAFVFLDALPLTPNGKIDGRALPAPRYDQQASDKFVTPRDVLEESIAQVWREVLHLERISVHDNFFELGGHSLTATQVFARLRTTLRSQIALRDMFDFPTIAEFAEAARILKTVSVQTIT